MSYRMIHEARRLMCDKFSILCNLAELNAKQLKEDEGMRIRIKKVRDDIPTPGYAYTSDAGYDLIAAEDFLLQPGATVKIPTGLAFEIAEGYQMEIRPRSGVTSKSSIRVQLGTIDASYRGEVRVICDNIAQEYRNSDFAVVLGHSYRADGSEVPAELNKYAHGTHIIRKGDKIAQGVITPVVQATFVEVDELGETDRGTGGFGSSGVTTKEVE